MRGRQDVLGQFTENIQAVRAHTENSQRANYFSERRQDAASCALRDLMRHTHSAGAVPASWLLYSGAGLLPT